MPNRSAPPTETRKSPVRLAVLVLLLVGVIGIVAVGFLTTLAFGRVAGEEFSADSFSRRQFWYYEIPLLGFQVTPISREDTTNALESKLQTGGYLPPAAKGPPQWDLAYLADDGGESVVQGDASILCDYLDAVDQDGNHLWLEWTDQHPELAGRLWPAVARLAQQRLYMFLPALFDAARETDDAQTLSRRLREKILLQYRQLAEIQTRSGNAERAARLLKQAEDYEQDGALDPPPNGS